MPAMRLRATDDAGAEAGQHLLHRRSARRELAMVAALVGAWLAMASIVHPGGEFPLADDWAYASSVRALLERGAIELRPWTPAITLSHTLWGAFASMFLGYSASTLRVSILVLGLVGVLATYGLLREIGARAALAALGALTLAVNPLYFALAGTFMTDVSFLALSTLALWGFVRTLRTGSELAFAGATAAALAATLNRQIGLALCIGFAAASPLAPAWSRRLRALLPLALALASLVAWELYAGHRGGPSLFDNAKTAEATVFLRGPLIDVAGRVLVNVLGMVTYLGLFVLPFAIVATAGGADAGIPGRRFRGWPYLVVMALAVTPLLAQRGILMPHIGNIWLPSGIGPDTLRDTFILKLHHRPEMPSGVRWALTACGVLGSLLVVRLAVLDLARRLRERTNPGGWSTPVLLVVVGGLFTASVLLAPCLDRYWLPLIPIVLAMAAVALPAALQRASTGGLSWAQGVAGVLIVVAAVYSVVGVHDHLAWNAARWAGARWLLEMHGAAPGQIDGGFEWNATHHYDPGYVVRPDRSWWWVHDDRWLLSFGPVAGRQVVRRVPYQRWLPPGRAEILVLERP